MTREEAIKNLVAYAYFVDEPFPEEVAKSFDMAIEALQERKTGKWVDLYGNAIPINEHGLQKGDAWCSECDHWLIGSDIKQYPDGNYCPNCGAKMEVDE